MFPPQIANLAVAAPGLPEDAVGWTARSAITAIQSLPNKVTIAAIEVFDRVQWGFVLSDDRWRPFRNINERATDFAIRTRREACEWIEAFPRTDVLFVIDFDDQSEAAEAILPR